MSKYESRVCIAEKNLPEGISYLNEETFETIESFMGSSIGIVVGYRKGDELVSQFKSDRDEATKNKILNSLIEGDLVDSKIRTTKISGEKDFSEKEYYYIIYKLKDHKSLLSTVSENISFCMNTSHEVCYEILFTDEEYSRYMYIDFKVKGSHAQSFFDQIQDLEDILDELIKDRAMGFKDDEYDDDGFMLDFYDKFGEKCDISLRSTTDLLNKISSVRIVKITTEIMNNY